MRTDYLLHFLVSAVIMAVLAYFLPAPWAFGITLLIGIGKEVYDKVSKKGTADCCDNIIGDYSSIVSFGESCYYNNIGQRCSNNSFGKNCTNNIFFNDCAGNVLGDDSNGKCLISTANKKSISGNTPEFWFYDVKKW